jgi:large-conductance mechanosensitive channel
MFKLAIGFVIGVAVGRPVLEMVNDHLTPPVRRRIAKTLNNITQRINENLEKENSK